MFYNNETYEKIKKEVVGKEPDWQTKWALLPVFMAFGIMLNNRKDMNDNVW